MLARNSLLEEMLPSLSTETMVLARSMSRTVVSSCSKAWFQAFSRARILPPSSLSLDCCALPRPTPSKTKLTATIAHFIKLIPCVLRDCSGRDTSNIEHGVIHPKDSVEHVSELANGNGHSRQDAGATKVSAGADSSGQPRRTRSSLTAR